MSSFNFLGGKTNLTQSKLLAKLALAYDSSDWINCWVQYEKWKNNVVGHYEWMKVNLLPQRIGFQIGKYIKIEIPEEINESKINSLWISLNKTAIKSLAVEKAMI